MSTDEAILKQLRALPPELQQLVMEYIDYLQRGSTSEGQTPSLREIWGNWGSDITQEDIAQLRAEMGKQP